MNLHAYNVSNANLISECHKRLNKIGKISYDKIAHTDELTCQILREISPTRLKELAKLNCFAANKIKKELDNKYGEKNYVLIAVGRSIASIAELMGKMGANTKIIPMSGLRRTDVRDISTIGLNIYKKFLNKIGLSKHDLKKNKNKTYILMDYTYYGRSLESTERILKRDDMLGNADNLIRIPVSEVLGDDYIRKGYGRLFEYCRFKDYSCVGRLPVSNLKDVFKKCSTDNIKNLQGNITQGLRNLFWFNVYDSMKRLDYERIVPIKELDALFRHHLAPKAVNNYVKREFGKVNNIPDKLS